MNMGYSPIGKFLKHYQLDHDILTKEMSKKMGISAAFISSVENGKRRPSKKFIDKFCQAYPLSKDEITALLISYWKTIGHVTIDIKGMTVKQQEYFFSTILNMTNYISLV